MASFPYRIFVLGAGFSRFAGMPLGDELFMAVLRRAKSSTAYSNILAPDLNRFIEYRGKVFGESLTESKVNLEQFISFLDLEHFLALEGSDTWGEAGNRSQMVVKNLIAEVLHDKMARLSEESFEPYRKFAAHLAPGDIIITFNYDTLLERGLEAAGRAYRLVPKRYSRVYPGGAEVETEECEVIVLKMHGSIDWFDYSPVTKAQEYFQRVGSPAKARHVIFDNPSLFHPRPIVDGPYWEHHPLKHVHRVKNLGEYFPRANQVSEAPLILSPSYSKLVYISPLRDFWYGFNGAGALNSSVGIIGFSLPDHDEYIRQALYALIENYQNYDPGMPDLLKRRLSFVDRKITQEEKESFQMRYRFVDWARTDCYFQGFDSDTVDLLFNSSFSRA